MKKNLLFLLLITGMCFSCNTPQKDSQRVETTKTDQNMTNEQLKEKVALALDDMKAKALEMGIEGVAAVSVLNSGDTVDWIGEMKVVGRYLDHDGGFNLVAVAWSKCAEVMATLADSGNPDHKPMTGELNYTGGAYDEFEGIRMAFAFSGATSEEDYVVAKHGIAKLKDYISEGK